MTTKHQHGFKTIAGTSVLALLLLLTAVGISSSALPVKASVRPVAISPVMRQIQPERTPVLVAAELNAVSTAIEQRKELLKRHTVISLRTESSGSVVGTWGAMLSDHPSWIVFSTLPDRSVTVQVSADRIEEELRASPSSVLPASHSCKVTSTWTDDQGVNRVQTDCLAVPGFTYDPKALAQVMAFSLSNGTVRADALVSETTPTVISASGQTLTLLATGLSTFNGSGAGRKANVRKGLNERLNNVWVPSGSTFSFNKVLGGKITTAAGWQMALTIFNGKDLIAAPGGGICQVSTTVYRSALLAGLPIVEQKNHSLYVTYYEAHGVGQDATVFPGQQDFEFLNDTGNPLLIQSWSEGDEATVNILGVPDGRETVLTGPYFASTALDGILVNGRAMRKNEIVWVRSVKKGMSAAPEQELRVARYQTIPKSLPKRSEITTIRNHPSEAVASVVDLVADSTAGQ